MDITVLVLLALSVFLGFRKGLIQEIVGLAALAAAFVIAVLFHRTVAVWLRDMIPAIPQNFAPTVAFVVCFIIVFLTITIAGWIVSKIIRATPLDFVDRLGGMAIGLLKGALVISIILLALAMVPLPKDVIEKMDRSTVIRSIRKVAPWVYQHTKGLWPKAREIYRDFQKQPEPRKVEQLEPI